MFACSQFITSLSQAAAASDAWSIWSSVIVLDSTTSRILAPVTYSVCSSFCNRKCSSSVGPGDGVRRGARGVAVGLGVGVGIGGTAGGRCKIGAVDAGGVRGTRAGVGLGLGKATGVGLVVGRGFLAFAVCFGVWFACVCGGNKSDLITKKQTQAITTMAPGMTYGKFWSTVRSRVVAGARAFTAMTDSCTRAPIEAAAAKNKRGMTYKSSGDASSSAFPSAAIPIAAKIKSAGPKPRSHVHAGALKGVGPSARCSPYG